MTRVTSSRTDIAARLSGYRGGFSQGQGSGPAAFYSSRTATVTSTIWAGKEDLLTRKVVMEMAMELNAGAIIQSIRADRGQSATSTNR
jgi:hypothetical protein